MTGSRAVGQSGSPGVGVTLVTFDCPTARLPDCPSIETPPKYRPYKESP
jgi:hypothetical protein